MSRSAMLLVVALLPAAVLCCSQLPGQQGLPPPVIPPQWWEGLCDDMEAPEGYHYGLETSCILALIEAHDQDVAALRAVRDAAINAAEQGYENDVNHAAGVRDACIEQAAGDRDGIRACHDQYALEEQSAANLRDGLITSANNAFEQGKAALLAQLIEDGRSCCVLFPDAEEDESEDMRSGPLGADGAHDPRTQALEQLFRWQFSVGSSPLPTIGPLAQ